MLHGEVRVAQDGRDPQLLAVDVGAHHGVAGRGLHKSLGWAQIIRLSFATDGKFFSAERPRLH